MALICLAGIGLTTPLPSWIAIADRVYQLPFYDRRARRLGKMTGIWRFRRISYGPDALNSIYQHIAA